MGVRFGDLTGFFASGLVFGFYIVITAFLFALFANDRQRFITAFIFDTVACATLLVIVSSAASLLLYIWIPIFAGLILMTLLCRRKFVLWFTWSVTAIFMAFAVLDLIGVYIDLRNIVDYVLWTTVQASMIVGTIVVETAYPLLILGLVITATVVRVRRKRSGVLSVNSGAACDKTTEEKSVLSGERYTASRVEKNGHATAGNILAAISYVLVVFGGKFTFAFSDGEIFKSPILPIIMLVLGLISGAVAMLLIKTARAYGYESGAPKFALYVWAWIMAAIVIVIIVACAVILMFFMSIGSDESFSDKVKNSKGDVYAVKDENGETRRLKYSDKEPSAYGRCMDDKGDWWETEDGGKTFSKCGLREIKDENGDTVMLYDVSGGSLGVFADNKGGMYESKDGGTTVKKLN